MHLPHLLQQRQHQRQQQQQQHRVMFSHLSHAKSEHRSSCPSPLAKASPQALRAAVEHKGYGNMATQRHGDTEAHATCGNYEKCCQSR